MPVSVVFLRAVVSAAMQMGIARGAGDSQHVSCPRALSDIAALLSDVEAELLVRGLVRQPLQHGLGLMVGERCTEASFHLLGQVWSACPSLRDAVVQTFDLGHEVLVNCNVQLIDTPGEAQIIVRASADSEFARFCAEVYAAVLFKIALRYASHDVSHIVSARFATNHRASAFRGLRGISISYGHSEHSVVVTHALMDRVTPGVDPRVLLLVRRLAHGELVAPRHLASWTEKVQWKLRQEAALAHVSVDNLARELDTTQRSLRRRLVREGTTLSDVVNAERRKRSTSQLVHSPLSIREISDALGYSDTSAFHRAFKRWTGTTPQECRNALDGPQSLNVVEPMVAHDHAGAPSISVAR